MRARVVIIDIISLQVFVADIELVNDPFRLLRLNVARNGDVNIETPAPDLPPDQIIEVREPPRRIFAIVRVSAYCRKKGFKVTRNESMEMLNSFIEKYNKEKI